MLSADCAEVDRICGLCCKCRIIECMVGSRCCFRLSDTDGALGIQQKAMLEHPVNAGCRDIRSESGCLHPSCPKLPCRVGEVVVELLPYEKTASSCHFLFLRRFRCLFVLFIQQYCLRFRGFGRRTLRVDGIGERGAVGNGSVSVSSVLKERVCPPCSDRSRI
jgi:hypothetical protein